MTVIGGKKGGGVQRIDYCKALGSDREGRGREIEKEGRRME